MKKTNVFLLSLAILMSGTATSCHDSTSYMGTIAGAQLGSTLGGAIGWLGGSGRGRSNGSALGTIVGTVGGAAIGAAIANNSAKKHTEYMGSDANQYAFGSDEWKRESSRVYGQNDVKSSRDGYASSSKLYISNLSFQDENGDGKLNKEETIIVSFTVQNMEDRKMEVELFLLEPNYYRDLEISQPKTVTIAPKEMVRYKAKVYCKHNLKGKTLNLQAHVRSQEIGDLYEVLNVRCDK